MLCLFYIYFLLGNISSDSFAGNKTKQPFSQISLDHIHEQINACMKGDGWAIRLTETPNALRRWLVDDHQISQMVREFEDVTDISEMTQSGQHHEQTCSSQAAFGKEMLALVDVLEDLGTHLRKNSDDLINLPQKT